MDAKTLKEQTRSEMLTELAFKNYNVGLIANAEHFLHLVQAMYPCNKADKLLKVIQKSKGTQQEDDNTLADLTESVKCLEIEQKSLNKENLGKPVGNVPKEEPKCKPSEKQAESTHNDSDNDEEEIEDSDDTEGEYDEEDIEDSDESEGDDVEEEEEQEEEIEDSNETETQRIERTLNSLILKKYNVADKVIGRALKLFPHNEWIRTISKKVQKEIKMAKEIAPRKEREHPNAENHAADYLFFAMQAKAMKNYDIAIMFCQVAEKWHDSTDSRNAYLQILYEKHPIDRRMIYKYSHTNEYFTQYGQDLGMANSIYKQMNDIEAEKALRKCYLTALPPYVAEFRKLIASKIEAAEII